MTVIHQYFDVAKFVLLECVVWASDNEHSSDGIRPNSFLSPMYCTIVVSRGPSSKYLKLNICFYYDTSSETTREKTLVLGGLACTYMYNIYVYV